MIIRDLLIVALSLSLLGVCSCRRTPDSSASSLPYKPPTEALFDSLFAQYEAEGTFLLQDLQQDTIYVFHEERANTSHLPASTFKIPNTLIALELGLTDTSELFSWDGTQRFVPQWNQDLKLAEAFRYSAVWVYQILAERIGEEAYRKWLAKIDYGNAKTGPDLRTFWLDGDIRISAYEQLDFLRRLENGSLAFGKAGQKRFRTLFSFEKTDQYDWKGKTGWTTAPDPGIGWMVGWVERQDERYLYAMNLDVHNQTQVGARVAITRQLLQHMGIIPQTLTD